MTPTRILIAEDHPQTVAACRAALEADGHEVVTARSLPEAARVLAEAASDLVILDAALPDGDALEFCSALSGGRGVRRVPFLLLVPPRFPDPLLSAMRPFGSECLFKPFHAADLRQRVQALLSRRPAVSPGRTSDAEPEPAQAVREEAAPWRYAAPSGMQIGGCRLERTLGHGATSTVYMGRHLLLDVPVAVKIFSASPAPWSQENLRRFVREARTAAKLQHPNVVPVLNAGVEKGFHFLVQRYIEGETLQSRIEAETRLDEPSTVRILLDIAAGLSAVHGLGILHRDVKPANILLATCGAAMLTDFGLARTAGRGEGSSESGLVGTPYYMAPEECMGKPVDGRADLYSLGATGYHAVTGRPPFLGDSPVDVIRGHVEEIPPSPRDFAPALSQGVSQVLMKLLSKSPRRRYGSADELIRALGQLHKG